MLEDGMMAFALLGAEWVMWVLVALSLLCAAVTLERVYVYLSDATPRDGLAKAIQPFMTSGDVGQLRTQLGALRGGESRVLCTGLEVVAKGPSSVEKAMIGAATAERMRLERGLAVLATVGSNAPFIGLFGTVLGVIKAFHDLALNPNDASSAVMAGIAEALVATAIGLLVAIPAVVLYNALSRWVKSKMNRLDSMADLIIANLYESNEQHHGK